MAFLQRPKKMDACHKLGALGLVSRIVETDVKRTKTYLVEEMILRQVPQLATDKIETASIEVMETHGSAAAAAAASGDALSRTKFSAVLKQSSTRSCGIHGLCFSFRAPEDFVLDGSVRLQM
ncbi:hypothetical protein Peur_000169 [Populus x canadensis]